MIKTAISYFIIDWCIDIFFDRIDKNISVPSRLLQYGDRISYDHTKLSTGDRVTVTVSSYYGSSDVVFTTLVDAIVVKCGPSLLILTYNTVVYDIDCGSHNDAERRYLNKDLSGLSIADSIGNSKFVILGRDGNMIAVLVSYDISFTNGYYTHEIISVEQM